MKAVSVLLFSAAASAITVTNSTTRASSSFIPSRTTSSQDVPDLTAAPTESGATGCCYVRPNFIGLGQWSNETVTATVATVVTQYLQYNNTVITTTTTYTNASATESANLQDLLPSPTYCCIYDYTVPVLGTSTFSGGLALVSPQPFDIIRNVIVGTGILSTTTSSGGSADTYCQAPITGTTLDPSFIYLPPSTKTHTAREQADIGQDFLGTFIDQLASSGTTIPGLDKCTVQAGEGAPAVHVPVSELTEHATTTLKIAGMFTAPGRPGTTTPEKETQKTTATPAPEPSRPAPETSQEVPTAKPTTENPPPAPAPQSSAAPAQPNDQNTSRPENTDRPANTDQPVNPNQPVNTDRPANTDTVPKPTTNDVPPAAPTGPGQNSPSPPAGNPAPGSAEPSKAGTPPQQTGSPELASSLTIGTTVVPVSSVGTQNGGGVVVGGTTLLPSAVATFDGHTLSLGPSGTNLVILNPSGPSTLPLFTPAPAPAVTAAPQPAGSIVVGTNVIPVSHPSNTAVGIVLPGDTTLAPGSAVTFQGQTLSLGSGGSSIMVVGSGTTSAIALFTPAPENAVPGPVIAIGSSSITVAQATASGGGVILPDGQTLLPGSQTTIAGTVLSLGTQGTQLVVGSSTVALSPPQVTAPPGTVVNLGDSSVTIGFATASGGGVVLSDGQTLLPGSQTTIDGTVLSLGTQGTELVVGSSTVALNGPQETVVNVGGSSLTVAYATTSGGAVVLPGGQTLLPGSATVVDGTTISLASGGTELVVGSSTVALNTPQETVVNVGGSSLTVAYATASGGGLVLPGGQTLLPGSTTVIDGTTISLASGGTDLVVGTSTMSLQSSKPTSTDASTTEDIGSYIWSGLGGGSPTSAPAPTFTAGSNGRLGDYCRSGVVVAAAIAVFELAF